MIGGPHSGPSTRPGFDISPEPVATAALAVWQFVSYGLLRLPRLVVIYDTASVQDGPAGDFFFPFPAGHLNGIIPYRDPGTPPIARGQDSPSRALNF